MARLYVHCCTYCGLHSAHAHSSCRKIDPKRAIPRQEHQRATKLFIGGLAGSVTSESMREFFSQFGKVIDSTVMLDRETGRSKGFGFVSFEDTNVQPFLGFGNLQIDGKLVSLKVLSSMTQLFTLRLSRSMSSWPNRDSNETISTRTVCHNNTAALCAGVLVGTGWSPEVVSMGRQAMVLISPLFKSTPVPLLEPQRVTRRLIHKHWHNCIQGCSRWLARAVCWAAWA